MAATEIQRARGEGAKLAPMVLEALHRIGSRGTPVPESSASDGRDAEGDALLHEALVEAGLGELPERPEDLLFFATGALYDRAQALYGRVRAERLLEELGSVLDLAWELDRLSLDEATRSTSDLPTSGVVRKRSRVQRLAHPSPLADEDESGDPAKDDTLPAPSNCLFPPSGDAATQSAPVALSRVVADTLADLESTAPPRATLPYMPALLVSGLNPTGAAARVLVVEADGALRAGYAEALRARGCGVATAPDRLSAARLVTRLVPNLVIGDLETLAPDFEPLEPALEELFGDSEPAPILLLSDQPRRERNASVARTLEKPVSAVELCDAVAALLPTEE